MNLDVEKTIREYLTNVLHMSLGTCANNKPWVCEVHFAEDEELNLYFRSNVSRRHSQEIAVNSQVAGSIITQHNIGEKPRGVYFEGTAEMLEDVQETDAAYLAISKKQQLNAKILAEQETPKDVKFYKITVADFYLFDARESQPAQKYHLPWKNNFNKETE